MNQPKKERKKEIHIKNELTEERKRKKERKKEYTKKKSINIKTERK